MTTTELRERVDSLMEDLDKVTHLLQMAQEALPTTDTGCGKAKAALWATDIAHARFSDSLAVWCDELAEAAKAAEVSHG